MSRGRVRGMVAFLDRTLLFVSCVILVSSIGFFLASHAGFSAVMIDLIVASILRR